MTIVIKNELLEKFNQECKKLFLDMDFVEANAEYTTVEFKIIDAASAYKLGLAYGDIDLKWSGLP